MKKLLFITLLAAATALHAAEPSGVARAFAEAPQSVFPLIDSTTRLDMVDYYNAGMAHQSTNKLKGGSAILDMANTSMNIKMTDASTEQLFLLPHASGDTIIGLIRTVATPGLDSSLTLYRDDWTPIDGGKMFTVPVLADWVTDNKHIADVEIIVPFILVEYVYNPADATLSLTNNLADFLSDDLYSTIAPYVATTLSYKWDGKKFSRQ